MARKFYLAREHFLRKAKQRRAYRGLPIPEAFQGADTTAPTREEHAREEILPDSLWFEKTLGLSQEASSSDPDGKTILYRRLVGYYSVGLGLPTELRKKVAESRLTAEDIERAYKEGYRNYRASKER